MSGANPTFLAKQLGHSLEMFFNVYADWINGRDDEREMAKIEAVLGRVNPESRLMDWLWQECIEESNT
jgi:integrase